MYVDVSSELSHVLHDSRFMNQCNNQITLNKIKYCENYNSTTCFGIRVQYSAILQDERNTTPAY